MKKIITIVLGYLFFCMGVNAETFSAALKKAYENNLELNAERESLNISEQELNISKGLYLPTVTLSGSKSREDTDKLTNQNGTSATINDVDPTSQSITITQTLIDFGRGAELSKSKIGIDLYMISCSFFNNFALAKLIPILLFASSAPLPKSINV